MSEKAHAADIAEGFPHKEMHNAKGENGACLNRHVMAKVRDCDKSSCAYRFQAYLQMEGDKQLYNWPKYKKLAEQKKANVAIADWPTKWLKKSLPKPEGDDKKGGDWDVANGKNASTNFRGECYDPYWHEAHHIVPNSTLRNTIVEFCQPAKDPGGLVNNIREGLLKEKYNLNFKVNMIMLPMDDAVAEAMSLPRHRLRKLDFHQTYSDHVKSQLKNILGAIAEQLLDHKNRKFDNLKEQIETLSKGLYAQIKATHAELLDEMPLNQFQKARMGPPTGIPG